MNRNHSYHLMGLPTMRKGALQTAIKNCTQLKNIKFTRQPYYRELFLEYNQLIRILQIVDLMEEVLATLVENKSLVSELLYKESRRLAGIILHAGMQDITNQCAPQRPDDFAHSIHLQHILHQIRILKNSPVTLPADLL
jgi:hypothetical protein